MSEDMTSALVKLSVIEVLLRDLYVEKFERTEQPIQTAAKLGEAYGKGNRALADPSIPQQFALLQQELTNQFFDDVVAELRRRAEIRENAKKQDPDQGD